MKKREETFIFYMNRSTLRAMISMYCSHHHNHGSSLCPECSAVYEYALDKLERCPFGDSKPPCTKCRIHCYSDVMRTEISRIMKYSGPRMLFKHPVLTFFYLVNKRRRKS